MERRLRRRRRRRTVSSGTVNKNDIGLRNNAILMMRARETTGDERKRQDN